VGFLLVIFACWQLMGSREWGIGSRVFVSNLCMLAFSAPLREVIGEIVPFPSLIWYTYPIGKAAK